MKSNQKTQIRSGLTNSPKSSNISTGRVLSLNENISRKLLEIKRISGAGEMTELNMALWRHLK
jgi:hypothetical protein